jgi:hypothetical protein
MARRISFLHLFATGCEFFDLGSFGEFYFLMPGCSLEPRENVASVAGGAIFKQQRHKGAKNRWGRESPASRPVIFLPCIALRDFDSGFRTVLQEQTKETETAALWFVQK